MNAVMNRFLLAVSGLAILIATPSCGQSSTEAVDLGIQDVAQTDTPPADLRTDLRIDVPTDTQLTDTHPVDTHQPDLQPTDMKPDTDSDVSGDTTIPGPTVWGWISAIEWNDVCDQWYLKTQWNGGIRAHFATGPSYQRALPDTLQFLTPKETVGDCTLYDSGLMADWCLGQCLCLDKGMECYEDNETKRWCDEDEVCVADPGLPNGEFSHGHCEPLPAFFNAGTIQIQGLKQAVSMTPDAMGRYLVAATDPNDLFDQGDLITATTSGGDLPPLSFETQGVAPLDVPNQVVSVRPDKTAVVSWVPADPGSRVQIYLATGSHDPNPLSAAIVCDVPDSQGQVEIDYSLFQRLYYLSCDGVWMMKCSRITRYTRDVIPMGQQQVELFVGSARNLQVMYE